MSRYRSKPTEVEAVQHDGTLTAIQTAWHLGAPVVWVRDEGSDVVRDVELRAGKAGVQGWVAVPEGHWIVHDPQSLADDWWPVDPAYFAAKYEALERESA